MLEDYPPVKYPSTALFAVADAAGQIPLYSPIWSDGLLMGTSWHDIDSPYYVGNDPYIH
jgi:hypothetical protein